MFGNFLAGNNALLGAKIEKNLENRWTLNIGNKQDFENPNQQSYMFTIFADDDQISVQITISDIDDNPPVITVNERECNIPVSIKFINQDHIFMHTISKENTVNEEDVTCTYLITDADQVGDVRKVQFSATPSVCILLLLIIINIIN